MLRIFPPLIIALALAILVHVVQGNIPSVFDVLGNLFCLQGICAPDLGGVYWTLPYEVWFYVLIAAIMCLFNASNKVRIVGCLFLFFVGCVFISLDYVHIMTLLLGVITFFLCDIRLPKYTLVLFIFGWIISFTLGILAAESHAFCFPLKGIYNPQFSTWMFALCVMFLMIYLCRREPEGKWASMIERIGNRWAPLTYCLFITHFSVLEFLKYLNGPIPYVNAWSIAYFFAASILCLIFGYLFWWFVEKHLTGWIAEKFKIHK